MSNTSTYVVVGTLGVIGLVSIAGLVGGLVDAKKTTDTTKNVAATPAPTAMGGTRRKHRAHRNRTRRA